MSAHLCPLGAERAVRRWARVLSLGTEGLGRRALRGSAQDLLVGPVVELDLAEELTGVDGVALGDDEPVDDARGRGVHLVLHLHRLDDDHRGPLVDALALVDEDADDPAWHRRLDLAGRCRTGAADRHRRGEGRRLGGLDLDADAVSWDMGALRRGLTVEGHADMNTVGAADDDRSAGRRLDLEDLAVDGDPAGVADVRAGEIVDVGLVVLLIDTDMKALTSHRGSED